MKKYEKRNHFLAGIHGSGKGHFASYVQTKLGCRVYSASELIKEQKQRPVDEGKVVLDPNENQDYLVQAVKELPKAEAGNLTLLDGHFVLKLTDGYFDVPVNTFANINLNKITVKIGAPSLIRSRLIRRDGKSLGESIIKEFQDLELARAEYVSSQLNLPLYVIEQSDYGRYLYLFDDDM